MPDVLPTRTPADDQALVDDVDEPMRAHFQPEAAPRPDVAIGNELHLRLWRHPAPRKPRLLFLHGYLDTGRSWDAVCARLDGAFDCTALTWRGHGESERVGRGGSAHLMDHLKDLTGVVLRAAEDGRPYDGIVAHSMGANIALMWAGAFSEHDVDLLLVDGLGPPAEPAADQPERWHTLLSAVGKHKPFRPAARVADAVDRLCKLNPKLTHQGAARMLRHALVPVDDGFAFPFDGRLRGVTPVRFEETTWTACCRRVRGRVHVIRADNGYVPDDTDERVSSRLAALRASIETLADAGHHLHVDAPDVLADRIRGFFGGGDA